MNIFFVCTGNTCRSPMAEAILRHKEVENIAVRSGGIHAGDGWPISEHAKALIEKWDMPYTPTSRAVSTEDLLWADYILTMTESHKRALLQQVPALITKTFTLKEFVEEEGDVQDPFGGDYMQYEKTFTELQQLMKKLQRKLMEGKE